MTPERLEELAKLAECMIIAHSECSSVPDTFGVAGAGIAELIAEVRALRKQNAMGQQHEEASQRAMDKMADEIEELRAELAKIREPKGSGKNLRPLSTFD